MECAEGQNPVVALEASDMAVGRVEGVGEGLGGDVLGLGCWGERWGMRWREWGVRVLWVPRGDL